MTDAEPGAEPTPRTESTENVVEGLVARCLEEGAETLEAVARVCGEHAGMAEEVLACLQALAAAGMFTSPRPDDEFPERLGDFRLLDRLGGGGMGVVYRARQESLQREVALKLIRPEQLYFPGARARFRREVEAVARMQHPGIVPVHAVGEEDGIPYFAMEHVRGCSVDRALTRLRGRPLESLSGRALHEIVCELSGERPGERDAIFDGDWPQTCFRVAAAVGGALEHAHDRRVLHRDVKPSNVMITPAGRVMLLDFGVSSAEGTSKLTRTGAQVGSLPYMSPEQAAGRHEEVDARADVYSLGVTLYEMLVLRLPYRGRDAGQTRALIEEGTPIPPRRLDPHLSWDAETVCLTAMQRERSQRYRDAAALRRDLHNVIERRSITARRPGPIRRARRWVQRNPTATVAAVLGFLLVVGGPLAFGLREQQTARRLERASRETREALTGEEQARTRAEANLRKACRAVDTLLVRIAEDRLTRLPGVQKLRADVLEDAVAFYDELLTENPGNAIVLAGAASSLINIGDLRQVIGMLEEALADYARSRDLWLRIEGENPKDRATMAGLGEVEHNAAYLLDNALRRPVEAEAHYRRALEWQRALADDFDFRSRVDVATTLSNLGALMARTQRFAEAAATLEEALGMLDLAYTEDPADGPTLQFLTNTLDLLGSLHMDQSRVEVAREYWSESLVFARELCAVDGENPGPRQTVVTAMHNLGFAAARLGHGAEAERRYLEAIEHARGVSRDFPQVVPFRRMLALCLNSLGLQRHGRPESLGHFEEAIAIGEKLVAENPDLPDLRTDLVTALENFANAHVALGHLDTGEQIMLRAIATLDGAMKSEAARTTVSFIERSAAVRGMYGGLLLHQKRWDEALGVLAEAARIWQRLIDDGHAKMSHRAALGSVLGNTAMCHRYRREFGKARELALRAIAIQQEALATNPEDPYYQRYLIAHLRELRSAELELFHFDAAVDAGRRILERRPGIAEEVLQAEMLCDVAARIDEDVVLSPADRPARREQWIIEALDRLEAAAAAGFRDVELLETTDHFRILDEEERYLDLLDAMEEAP